MEEGSPASSFGKTLWTIAFPCGKRLRSPGIFSFGATRKELVQRQPKSAMVSHVGVFHPVIPAILSDFQDVLAADFAPRLEPRAHV